MKEIVIDFRRYRGLGLRPREAFQIAVMKYRVRKLLEKREGERESARKDVVAGGGDAR